MPGHHDLFGASPIVSHTLRRVFQHGFVAPLARDSFRDDNHILVVLAEPLCRLRDPTVYRDRNRQS
jgi:hypothetical protein